MSALSEETDEALLGRVAGGDQTAMREIYDRHHLAVTNFATAKLRDRSQALDVLQDVMLDVWRKPEGYSGRSALRTWLLALTRNKAIDRIRKSSRMDYGDEGDLLIDEAPIADDVVAAAQDKQRLLACLDGLPEAQRSAVQLTFFQGLTVAEAAEVEDVPPGTIKTRIFHAKQKLADCLRTHGVNAES